MNKQLTTNFHSDEFRCKDKNRTKVPDEYFCNVQELAAQLQILRDDINLNRPTGAPAGIPLTLPINSGYRTPEYNKSIGGAKNSAHMKAMAADITQKYMTPKQLKARIESLIKAGKMKDGGIGLYPGFVHYDVSTPRRW
jgi:hypothetical protein